MQKIYSAAKVLHILIVIKMINKYYIQEMRFNKGIDLNN